MNKTAKNNNIFIAIGVAVVVLVVLAVFFLKQDPSTVVTSSDGKLALEIPASAVPEEYSLEDISAARIPAEDQNGTTVVVYKLLPDGLTFDKPVMFNMTMEIEPGDVPFAFHIDTKTGNITSIDNYHAELDYDKKTATITGTIDHFSYIFLGRSGINVIMFPNSKKRLGDSQKVEISVVATEADYSYVVKTDDGSFNIQYTRKGDATVSGFLKADGGIVTPTRIPNALPNTVLMPGNTVRGSGTFTCVKNGLAQPVFDFRIDATIETEYVGLSFMAVAGDLLLGKQTEVSTSSGRYLLAGENYDCFGTPETQQSTDNTTRESAGAGAKLCGGIFGPCDKK